MFEFGDLFQWDRFNEAASTEFGRERKQTYFIGEGQSRSVGRHNGGDHV